MGVFQELEAVPVFESITKWSATVPTTDTIPEFLRQAVERSSSGRPGPVFVELPEDVIFNEICRPDLDHISKPAAPAQRCDEKLVGKAIDLLHRAERPLMIIGKGVRWSVPFDTLQQLIEQLEIPFITSPMGRGFVSDDHPLCCNEIRSFVQARADVVLVLAARLNWMFRYGNELADAQVIQVDINREEIGRNRDPTVALHGDAGECVRQLVCEIDRRELSHPAQNGSWRRRIRAARRHREGRPKQYVSTIPMSPDELARSLRDLMSDDTIFVTDGNISMIAAQRLIRSQQPVSRLDAGTNGCMGIGIPFAMGAKLARPDHPVVAFCGDYGFSLGGIELETCIRHAIPLIVIVANNHGLCGALKQRSSYPRDYPERVTMFQHGIRYDEIARTLGCHSEFVEHPDELGPAFDPAVRSGRTACINVFIDPEAPLLNAWGDTAVDASLLDD